MASNPISNHLVELSFQGVNWLFVLAFEDDAQRASNNKYYLPNIEIKDYNVMIYWKNFFAQPIRKIKQHMRTLEKLLLVKEMIMQPVVY